MAQKMLSSQIPALSLSTDDLRVIMGMAEASIKSAEFCDHLFGGNEVVQQRAVASDIQARCQTEIARQGLIAEERARAKQEQERLKQIEVEEAKKKAVVEVPAEPAKG